MRQIVLLRGINLGPRNRIAMPALRAVLSDAGFEDVRTYVQSGNVVLSGDAPPEQLARKCKRLIAEEFDLDVPVVVRSRDELAEVVRRDPYGDVVTNPKRYQVTFLAEDPDPETVARLEEARADPELLKQIGREVYAWHPDGIGRSKLATLLSGRGLGVTATARNWTTVTSLLELADA